MNISRRPLVPKAMPFTSVDPEIAVTDKTLAKLRLYGTVIITESNYVPDLRATVLFSILFALFAVLLPGFMGLAVLLIYLPIVVISVRRNLQPTSHCTISFADGNVAVYDAAKITNSRFREMSVSATEELGNFTVDSNNYRPRIVREGETLVLLQILSTDSTNQQNKLEVQAKLWVEPTLTDPQIHHLLTLHIIKLSHNLYGQNVRITA